MKALEITKKSKDKRYKAAYGIDLDTGNPLAPDVSKVFDNVCVKRNFMSIAPALAQQLLQVDEIIRAGKQMGNDKMKE